MGWDWPLEAKVLGWTLGSGPGGVWPQPSAGLILETPPRPHAPRACSGPSGWRGAPALTHPAPNPPLNLALPGPWDTNHSGHDPARPQERSGLVGKSSPQQQEGRAQALALQAFRASGLSWCLSPGWQTWRSPPAGRMHLSRGDPEAVTSTVPAVMSIGAG